MMRNLLHCQNTTMRSSWTSFVFLLLSAVLVTGVTISPCGSEGIREIFYDQPAIFNCADVAEVHWRIQYGNNTSHLLSCGSCNGDCEQLYTFDGLFTLSVIDCHTRTMTINPVNNTTSHKYALQLLNGSLECIRTNRENMSARCGLDYVYPPRRVRCIASAIAWLVNVSCDIKSIFSSRGNYKCQLIRNYNQSQNSTIENVAIVMSPNREKITENILQVSGTCEFNTTLPAEEGIYSYSVSISPGMRNFGSRQKWFTVERPRRPIMSCYPQPYVLENTDVRCTCSTTSLGQPAGLLTWIINNQTRHTKTTKQDKLSLKPHGVNYTQTLTLLDHDNTWFRCDVIWGAETIQGNNYTAQVGYSPRTPRFSVGGTRELVNQTTMERDHLHFVCESDGRPKPTVHIYNLDKNTDVWRDSSPSNYTFIARCEDAATYKCYARNMYSTQSNINASVGLDLYVRCKPRDISIADFGKVVFGNETEELNFDVMAYPVPHEHAVWFVGGQGNKSGDIAGKIEDSEMNVTCNAHAHHRFLSTCTLTIFSVPFNSGFYKVQVANEHGDQNFTVEISYDYDEPPKVQIAVIVGVAVAVVMIITVVVLIVVAVKRKRKALSEMMQRVLKTESSTFERIVSTNSQNLDWNSGNDEGGQLVQAPEIIYETPWDAVPSRAQGLDVATPSYALQPCQAPLYAVVDKMKKANKKGTEDKKVSGSFHKETNALYAVVGKVRGKALSKRAKEQRTDRDQSPKTRKDPWKKVEPTKDGAFCTDDGGADYVNKESFAMHPLLSQSEASGTRNGSSSASRPHEPNDGRWENDDGLIYTLPAFDVRNDVRRPAAPRSEETEYCTLREMENKFPALDKR